MCVCVIKFSETARRRDLVLAGTHGHTNHESSNKNHQFFKSKHQYAPIIRMPRLNFSRCCLVSCVFSCFLSSEMHNLHLFFPKKPPKEILKSWETQHFPSRWMMLDERGRSKNTLEGEQKLVFYCVNGVL